MSTARGELPQTVYERSLDCVHCGLCLMACPTYLETGRESSSPRGRIYLMRGVAEGRIPLDGLLADEAQLCLGCRACESACPSGVQYGEMLELTRDALARAGVRRGMSAWLERLALRRLVPSRARLRAFVDLVWLAQRTRLDRVVLRLLPSSLGDAYSLLPALPSRHARRPLPALTPAEGERRGRVALLTGCVMAELFADVHRATARVLARNGFDVIVPAQQGCCGALQAHSGDLDKARSLARSNRDVFVSADVDAVVVNSAGCGAAMRDVSHWLPGEADDLAALTRDVCEFLDDAGLRPTTAPVAARVCYDDPCHLVHGQGVSQAPRRLLRAIAGLELVEQRDPGACCGAAGTYNLTQPAMSRRVLAAKLDALAEVDPDVIASGNPGCLMQLAAGVRQRGLRARVVHPVELLAEAYL